MKNYNYQERKKKLEIICKKTTLIQKTDLISVGKISNNYLNHLQYTSKNLLLSSIVGDKKKININTSYKSILDHIAKKLPDNITHNGMVVPRKENSLEFNLFLKSFFQFLEDTKLMNVIDYFVSPPQLRIKFNNKKKLSSNSSEYVHSDAWTNHNTDRSYTLYLPIFGDVKNNYVEFYKPKKKILEKDWFKPQKFIDGSRIQNLYKKAKVDYKLGKFIVTDCATLHKTVNKFNSKPRVSMDIAFIPKGEFKNSKIDCHVKSKEFLDIGYKSIMVFKNSFKESLKKILKKKRQSLSNRKIIKF